MRAKAISLLAVSFLLAASGCGGSSGTAAQELTSVSGRVIAGPVSGADVSVLPLLNTGALGSALGTGTTDSQGFFSFDISSYAGAVVVRARGGEYVDEATGDAVVAGDLDMASLAVLAKGEPATVLITAATTIATRRAMVLAADPTMDAVDAMRNGVAMVEEYYGFVGILDTPPADLTAGPVAPGAAAEYGALNAGFSQLAASRGFYLWSLVSSLAEDASDGSFDSAFYAGSVYVQGPSGEADLPHTSGGLDLVDAITAFLGGARNASGLTTADLSINGAIERHVINDPKLAFCITQPRIDGIVPPVGPVDQDIELTLHGRFPNLDNVSLVVTFDGFPGQLVKGSDTELQVIAPTRTIPGKVDVAVRCENNHVYGIAPEGFEYYVPNLTPVITSVTPDQGPSAGGTLLEVTGQLFDPTAIVEVGGIQARTVARLGRTGLVVAVPDGTGMADVVVRQTDTQSAPYAALPGAFTYFGQGTGEEPEETQLDGEWATYSLGHEFPDTVMVVNADLVFTGGTFTETTRTWIATPTDPLGTTATIVSSGTAHAFADGTLWMRDPEMDRATRSFLTQERDVFIIQNEANTEGPVWLGAGIRHGTGMSNASLKGTWCLGLFTHAYADGTNPRTVSSAWGTAEFDGSGGGSVGLIRADCAADPASEDTRGAAGTPLTYAVGVNGTLTITVEPGDGPPIVFRGSLTQAADLGVGVSTSNGDAQFFMMVPSPKGFTESHLQGSWYGGGLAFHYEATDGGVFFAGGTMRMLADGHGEGVTEVQVRGTSAEGTAGISTETHADTMACGTTGFVFGGPDDLFGFVGASRRFVVVVPANLDNRVDVQPIESMGASLLLRRPATYSSWTLDDGAYNAVGISTEYKEPGSPLSLFEENASFLTKLSFQAAANVSGEEESDLVGLAVEPAGARQEKDIVRWAEGDIDINLKSGFPEFRGPYAVFGDGRILMSVVPTENRIAASEGALLEGVAGELTGNADLILLRNDANPDGASALVVLARAGNPTPDGIYHGAGVSFSYVTGWEWAAASLGTFTFDDNAGEASGDFNVYAERPDGGIYRDSQSNTGVPYTVSDGVVTTSGYPPGDVTGVVTPDGNATFFVNLSESADTMLIVALKQPATPVASAGSYRAAGFAHRYLTNDSMLPVEGRKQVLSGAWRITNRLDAGFVSELRTNTGPYVDRQADLFADQSLAVNADGSIVWPGGSMRGWFGPNGKYAFLINADVIDSEVYPGSIDIRFLHR